MKKNELLKIRKALIEAKKVISQQNNGCCLVSILDAIKTIDKKIKKLLNLAKNNE